MERSQSGDEPAYQQLLAEIAPYLRNLVRRHLRSPQDIEDTIQDILLTLHTVVHAYDPARPFTPWLVTLGRRRVADRLRKLGRIAAYEEPFDVDSETIVEEEANPLEAGVDGEALSKAVDRLPRSQRVAVMLLKLQEMSLKEAASKSHMSIASLKVALHRALKSLRSMLGQEEDP